MSGGNDCSVGAFGASAVIAGQELFVGAPRSGGPTGSADGTVFISRLGALTAAAGDVFTTDEDVTGSAPVLANDAAGPEGSLDPAAVDVTVLRPPRRGTATVNPATGTISYAPAANFSGQDSFSYVAGGA